MTYPLTTAMLTVPKSKVVRGFSFFGVSFVYVIFEDGTDIYWARSRVLEYLNSAAAQAAGRGHAGTGTRRDRRRLGLSVRRARRTERTSPSCARIQDWYVRYGLAKAEGVAEVASVGGFVKQYNVVVDPLPAASLRHPARRRFATRSAPATSMSAGASSSWRRPNSSSAAAATSRASPISSRSS